MRSFRCGGGFSGSWVGVAGALAVFIAGALQPPGCCAAAEASPPPGGASSSISWVVPGVSSVAVNDDVTALFQNPAAIGRSLPGGFFAGWSRAERGENLDLAAAAFSVGGFAAGYQRDRLGVSSHSDRVLLGCRIPLGDRLALGSRQTWERRRWQREDGYVQRGSHWRWDLGLLARPARFLSLGAVASDLNQSKLLGQVDLRSYTLGLGVRPLSWDHGSRLTFYADLSGREKAVWKDTAVLDAGLSIEPLPGIELSGSVRGAKDSAPSYRLGLGLHLRQASALCGTLLARDAGGGAAGEGYRRTRSVYAVEAGPARQRSMFGQSVLAKVDLAGVYADESQSGLPVPFLGGQSTASIRPVLRQLARAEKDPDVKGLLLEVGHVSMGALSSEVREGISRVRAQGKPVVAHLNGLDGISQYYIVSACDRVVLDPVGYAGGLGFRADLRFYGAMLDSAGIRIEKVHHGKYKSAGEELVFSQASEGMKEEFNSIIDDIREQMAADISRERKIVRPKLEELCNGQILEAPKAVAEGLVDSLGDSREAGRLLARLAGNPKHTSPVAIAGWRDREYAWASGPKVAVLWVDGAIETGKSRRGLMSGNIMGSETVVAQIRALEHRRDVRAVVLRIDSGGGDGLASDQMWRAIEDLQKSGKKVIASMSRVAGSGGYYIACGTDEIFADPMTITGSIGVLMIKPDLAGFYRKHRIGVETFERGRMMGMYSNAVPFTEEQKTHMQAAIDYFYDHFLGRVAAGRPLTKEQIDAVGQGRIWTGRQALERKLIDRVGGLREAIDRARELAGLPAEAKVVQLYRPGLSFIERVLTHGEEAALGPAVGAGLAWTSGASLLDLWLLQRIWASPERSGAVLGWRAEDPDLELLDGGF